MALKQEVVRRLWGQEPGVCVPGCSRVRTGGVRHGHVRSRTRSQAREWPRCGRVHVCQHGHTVAHATACVHSWGECRRLQGAHQAPPGLRSRGPETPGMGEDLVLSAGPPPAAPPQRAAPWAALPTAPGPPTCPAPASPTPSTLLDVFLIRSFKL